MLSRTAEEAAATGIQLEVVDHNSLRHQNDPNIMHGASLCFLWCYGLAIAIPCYTHYWKRWPRDDRMACRGVLFKQMSFASCKLARVLAPIRFLKLKLTQSRGSQIELNVNWFWDLACLNKNPCVLPGVFVAARGRPQLLVSWCNKNAASTKRRRGWKLWRAFGSTYTLSSLTGDSTPITEATGTPGW